MPRETTGQVPIADAIKNLRRELETAIAEGEGKTLRFDVESIDVELKCTVSREANAEVGGAFWVINTKGGAKIGDQDVQTIRLKLNPKSDGKKAKLSGKDKIETGD